MAQIISKDRVPYRIWDKINGVWNKLNFTTNAKSVDADDGKTLETKVGALNGITSDLSCEDESIAISAKAVNDSLSANGLQFKFGYDGDSDQYGYYGADGSLIPFRKIITAYETLGYYKGVSYAYTLNVDITKGDLLIAYDSLSSSTSSCSGTIFDNCTQILGIEYNQFCKVYLLAANETCTVTFISSNNNYNSRTVAVYKLK